MAAQLWPRGQATTTVALERADSAEARGRQV